MNAISNPVPAQINDVKTLLQDRLGANLLALYLYGSHLLGGLKPGSDIDLLAVLDRRLVDAQRHGLMQSLLEYSAPPGNPGKRALEVTCIVHGQVAPWRHPAMRELQFGEWLRGALQSGQAAGPEADPDLALLVTQARSHGIALHGPPANELLPEVPPTDVRNAMLTMLPEVARNLVGEEKHALLTLARMWVTLDTGEIVPKDVAVDRVAARLQPAHRVVLERARDAYLGRRLDDWAGWQHRVEDCVAAMLAKMPLP